MSHFTRLETRMVDKEYLISALRELGYKVEEGNLEIRGYGGQKTSVEIKVATPQPGYDIGFRKAGDSYECVADWWGVKGTSQEKFLREVTQRYAYRAARAKLEEQGFSLVEEEKQPDGRIRLVLRRMA